MKIFLLLLLLPLMTFKINNIIAEYTTIGQKIWFGELIEYINNRIKYDSISKWITNLSYSKLFICKPCHVFWISFLTGISTSRFIIDNNVYFLLFNILYILPISLLGYLNQLGHDKK